MLLNTPLPEQGLGALPSSFPLFCASLHPAARPVPSGCAPHACLTPHLLVEGEELHVAPVPDVCPHRAPCPVQLHLTWALSGGRTQEEWVCRGLRGPLFCQNANFAVGWHKMLLLSHCGLIRIVSVVVFSDYLQYQTGTLSAILAPSRASLAAGYSGCLCSPGSPFAFCSRQGCVYVGGGDGEETSSVCSAVLAFPFPGRACTHTHRQTVRLADALSCSFAGAVGGQHAGCWHQKPRDSTGCTASLTHFGPTQGINSSPHRTSTTQPAHPVCGCYRKDLSFGLGPRPSPAWQSLGFFSQKKRRGGRLWNTMLPVPGNLAEVKVLTFGGLLGPQVTQPASRDTDPIRLQSVCNPIKASAPACLWLIYKDFFHPDF